MQYNERASSNSHVLLAVANSCTKTQRPGSEVSNRQTTESSPKNSCDFSSYKPFKIGMLQAPVIHLFQPSYRQEPKDRKITGAVVVKVLVNVRSGDVEGAYLVEGNEIFQRAATEAARNPSSLLIGAAINTSPHAMSMSKGT